ncbi:hypothetical protein [Hydrogenophaga defluvii]|uniref:Uncharacterized protein n=1 Tax=Hydrogenophaga defluvii TaxID=249410 RepID=A0ABW2SCN2_9BURK
MSNYREQAISGQKWVRSNSVQISNPYQGLPVVRFGEEEIAVLSDGKTINTPLEGLTEPFTDPAKTFPLLNPVTGEALGATASYQDVYVLLHSLYIALAVARDAPATAPE